MTSKYNGPPIGKCSHWDGPVRPVVACESAQKLFVFQAIQIRLAILGDRHGAFLIRGDARWKPVFRCQSTKVYVKIKSYIILAGETVICHRHLWGDTVEVALKIQISKVAEVMCQNNYKKPRGYTPTTTSSLIYHNARLSCPVSRCSLFGTGR